MALHLVFLLGAHALLLALKVLPLALLSLLHSLRLHRLSVLNVTKVLLLFSHDAELLLFENLHTGVFEGPATEH